MEGRSILNSGPVTSLALRLAFLSYASNLKKQNMPNIILKKTRVNLNKFSIMPTLSLKLAWAAQLAPCPAANAADGRAGHLNALGTCRGRDLWHRGARGGRKFECDGPFVCLFVYKGFIVSFNNSVYKKLKI